jgi:hypothetical protein
MRGHICTVDEVWYFVYPKGGQQLRGHAEVDERLACIPPDRAEQVTCEGVSMRACACECVCMRAHACGRTMLVVMALYCALQI